MTFSRPLLLLTLAVAAAHALLLAGVTAREKPPVAIPTPPTFSTRTVAAAAPAAPAPTPTATAKPAAARSAQSTPVRRARPVAKPAIPSTAKPKALAPSKPAPPQVWQMPSSAELLALGFTEESADQTEPSTESNSEPSSANETPTATAQDAPQQATTDPSQAASNAAPTAAADTANNAAPDPPNAKPKATEPVPIKLPPPRRLDFEVNGKAKGFHYSALAELVWQHDATSYRAHQEVKVVFLGSRSQTSVGSITEWGLQPKRFGDKARSERAAHFDFAAGRATFSANTPPAPIEPGAQDRLSVFLQLGAMLAAAPSRYPAGTDISMTTVSARGADVWTFAVQPQESLNLPLGSMDAVPLTRLPRREYDQKAQVWLAPSLGYLPARIRITEANGDFVELNLRSETAP